MTRPTVGVWRVGLVAVAVAFAGFTLPMNVEPALAQDVAIDRDDIGGVVTGPGGPEAGVWVIAETRDLGTRYIKAVVTDDSGRPQTRYGT